jgi:hypothetical protein
MIESTFGILMMLKGFQASFNVETDENDFALALLHDE